MTTNIPAREAVVRDLETIHCELKRGLESAIRAGSSTEKLRSKLAENADKLDAARAELQAAQGAERQQGDNALRAAANSLADEAIARVAGAAEALAVDFHQILSRAFHRKVSHRLQVQLSSVVG